MSLSLSGITLHVADVEALLEFYMRIPGAELAVHRPGQFALLRIGSGRLGLLKHETPGFHVEFDCDNLDAAYEQLRAVGLATKGPPTRKPWGERDLLLLDPDGHMLEFDEAEEARGQLWLQDQTERPSDASADTAAPA